MNVLQEVAACGRDEFLEPGGIWLPEMEVNFALAVLKRARWDDYTLPRLRRHSMIVGPMGVAKSTLAERFLRDYCGLQNILAAKDLDTSRGTYFEFQSGTSWERIRGGISDGIVQVPIARTTDMLLCSELFDFLGHSPPARKQRIDALNTFLESGEMSVNLVKMTGSYVDGEQQEKLDKYSVIYNPELGSLFYHAITPLIACTRFFEEDEIGQMRNSGLLSRFSIVAWTPNKADQLIYYENARRPRGISPRRAGITNLNLHLRRIKWTQVNYPDVRMVEDGTDYLWSLLSDVEEDTGAEPTETRSLRDIGFVAQCITAAAVLRTGMETLGMDNVEVKLEYDAKDMRAVRDLIDVRASASRIFLDRYAATEDKKRGRPKVIGDREQLLQLLRGFMYDDEGEVTSKSFDSNDFVKHIMSEVKVTRAHAYTRIKNMIQLGILSRPSSGRLSVTEETWESEFETPEEASVPW